MPFDPLPLTARFDLLQRVSEEDSSSSWSVLSRDGSPFSLGIPAYSRITSDVELDDVLRETLLSCFGNYGIPWLDKPLAKQSTVPSRVAIVAPDVPIESDGLMGSSAVQFRFFGGALQKSNPSLLSYWKPSMFPELFGVDQLAKKVDAVRTIFFGKVPVGASLIVQEPTVYEDVRFLIESGFDFVELVSAVQYDFRAELRLDFDRDLKSSVTRAVEARRDGRSNVRLWLSAPCLRATDWVDWMRMGIDACCLDSYLAGRRPSVVESAGSFAGIRVQSVSKHDWIRDAVRELQTLLLDAFKFHSL
jgi:hypothetical protein